LSERFGLRYVRLTPAFLASLDPLLGRSAALEEAHRLVARHHEIAVMREAIEERLGHFRVAKHTVQAMFSHVIVGVNDPEVSRKFYDALLGTLGIDPGVANRNRYIYRTAAGSFAIPTPINGEPATFGHGSTLGFSIQSPEQADAFHAAGVANGGTTCEDPPAYREGLAGKRYLVNLRDPDGSTFAASPIKSCSQAPLEPIPHRTDQ
jgi:catechol 2,3-dioxygenase-like lactoylglutathione lyase family enzyme